MSSICLSGGADGSDLAWGKIALENGHGLIHYSFPGHMSRARMSDTVMLSHEDLVIADPYLKRANETLKRSTGIGYVRKLLQRNWHQVKDAASVYAVAVLDEDRGGVKGGTAWAVQMFIDRHPPGKLPVYVLDPSAREWHEWALGWRRIDRPPIPVGNWAGIGTRNLDPESRAMMEAVFTNATTDLHHPDVGLRSYY